MTLIQTIDDPFRRARLTSPGLPAHPSDLATLKRISGAIADKTVSLSGDPRAPYGSVFAPVDLSRLSARDCILLGLQRSRARKRG
jgi:hypothetical protein